MKISHIEALKAMEMFLDKYYLRDKSDDLGLLLSDICLDTFIGGATADPAAWEDWEDAIVTATTSIDKTFLTEFEAFKSMVNFLRAFSLRINSQDIKNLLKEVLIDNTDYKPHQEPWLFWQKCLNDMKNLQQ